MTGALSIEKSLIPLEQKLSSTTTIDTPNTILPLENQQSQDVETQSIDKDVDTSSNPPPLTGTRVALLFLGLALCVFLACLDISIIAAALPRITSDFSAQSQMSWVATAYLIAYNAFNPLYGRFSDIFGRKKMILVALAIFLVGSVGCAAAQSILMLILFRAVQGTGACGLASISMIIVGDLFVDVAQRARYQSIIWATYAVSSILGPLLGGVFVEHATWRWCFWMNLPLGALASVVIVLFYKMPFQKTGLKEQLRRIDYLGVFFIMAAITCLLLPLTMGGTTFAWNSPAIIIMFCVFAVLMGLIFMGCTFYIPLYFQVVQGASTTSSGARWMANALGFCISTTLSSIALKWVKDYRIHMWSGLVLMTVGVGVLILFDVETSIAQQVVPIFVIGFGNGMIFQNCIIAAQQAAPKEDMAVATALCQSANSIGSAIGVAVCAAALNNALVRNLNKLPAEMQGVIEQFDVVNNVNAVPLLREDVRALVIQAYAVSFQFLFKVLTPIVGLALLMSLFLRKGK
ncbi:hypothetical protein BGZ93_005533 [Podila epicladia]|nr:hypothetical protein BGZ93_005533 [Podila epicladia]